MIHSGEKETKEALCRDAVVVVVAEDLPSWGLLQRAAVAVDKGVVVADYEVGLSSQKQNAAVADMEWVQVCKVAAAEVVGWDRMVAEVEGYEATIRG